MRRPTVLLSSKSHWLRTPTRISFFCPGFTTSVTSKLNGSMRSKFSPTFCPFTHTSASPATASKYSLTAWRLQSAGTSTVLRIHAIFTLSHSFGYDG